MKEYVYCHLGMNFCKNNYVNNRNKYHCYDKELIYQAGMDCYDYAARFYDASLGRWHVIDPQAEKYIDITSYAYVSNNPLLFIDPDGEKLWVYYDEEKTAKFKLFGREFSFNYTVTNKVEYTGNSNYEGDNAFVKKAFGNLDKMKSGKDGEKVLNSLITSESDYNIKNEATKYGAMEYVPNESGGGDIIAGALMMGIKDHKELEDFSHEIFHGYQHENGFIDYSINMEVDAYIFGASISKRNYS